MTMRTLLTAAAIISSAFGASQGPTGHDSFHSNVVPLALAGADAQLSAAFTALDQQANPLLPEPWAKADPADSLYRLAREALSRGDYKRAAEIFHGIPERYPQSAYTTSGQALYYEAFALYRSGGDDELNTARDRLNQLKERYPAIAKKDGAPLLTRVCGELAKRGDVVHKAAGNPPEGSRPMAVSVSETQGGLTTLIRSLRGISSAAARPKASTPALTRLIAALPGIGSIESTPLVRVKEPPSAAWRRPRRSTTALSTRLGPGSESAAILRSVSSAIWTASSAAARGSRWGCARDGSARCVAWLSRSD